MSAPNPVPPSDIAGDVRAYEPSMEEILASIRRIIADDQSIPGRSRGDEKDMTSEEPVVSVHVLRGGPDGEAAATTTSVDEDLAEAEPQPEPQPLPEAIVMQAKISAPQYPAPEGPRSEPPHMLRVQGQVEAMTQTAKVQDDGGNYFDPPQEYDRPEAATPAEAVAPLFSSSTNSSVLSAFNVLAASRLADNSEELVAMAREMIRPLLRSWLDENLPSMVERLVRDEIERVARGGR